jgi:hypothetical protein
MTHHPAFGSQLKWDPAGGTAYVAIGQVKDISGPSIARGDIDVSDHDSSDGYREFLPGLVDGGAYTFTIAWDSQNTAHLQGVGTGVIGDLEQDGCTLPAFQHTLTQCAGTAVWTFDGYVNGFTMNNPVEGEITADLSVKISGKPTMTVT